MRSRPPVALSSLRVEKWLQGWLRRLLAVGRVKAGRSITASIQDLKRPVVSQPGFARPAVTRAAVQQADAADTKQHVQSNRDAILAAAGPAPALFGGAVWCS